MRSKWRRSRGGVLAGADPWQNVVRTGVAPWPPPELLQKVYQSRQARAFSGTEQLLVTSNHGFYSDLQSLHSEDAITWSVFGPIAYASPVVRISFVETLLRSIDIDSHDSAVASVWLWRRLPHPDTLVSGGPEIDFGVQTESVFLLGEAKWLSGVDAAQGVNRDKDQLTLRHEFCQKYGARLLRPCRHFVVLGVSLDVGMVPTNDTDADGIRLSQVALKTCSNIFTYGQTWRNIIAQLGRGLASAKCVLRCVDDDPPP